jgi:acyl transferase domain-containing protein
MRQAYHVAGLAPETVSLVECHATGTPVGDTVEVQTMARVFADAADVPLGSAKSNLGHLITAAGAAGLLKVLGAMRAGIRPATLNADEPMGALGGTRLRLLTEPEEWPSLRRAAVSAFGFGGNNAHLIVDAWTGDRAVDLPPPRRTGEVAIVAVAARIGDADDTAALVTGAPVAPRRTEIPVALPGLRFPRPTWNAPTPSRCSYWRRPARRCGASTCTASPP